MSITIRLSRIGRKNQPAYKMVVSNTRDKRNGKYVDIIGHFNPLEEKDSFTYDKEKYEKWVKRGALVTEAVKKLVDKKYEYIKYEPKKAVKKEREDVPNTSGPVETKAEEAKEEKEKEKEEKTEEKHEDNNEKVEDKEEKKE